MTTQWTKPLAREVVIKKDTGDVVACVTLSETGVTLRLKGHMKLAFIAYTELLSRLP